MTKSEQFDRVLNHARKIHKTFREHLANAEKLEKVFGQHVDLLAAWGQAARDGNLSSRGGGGQPDGAPYEEKVAKGDDFFSRFLYGGQTPEKMVSPHDLFK